MTAPVPPDSVATSEAADGASACGTCVTTGYLAVRR